MKIRLFFIGLCAVFFQGFSQNNPTLINIPSQVFVNGGSTDFKTILSIDKNIKEAIKVLHSHNELSHDYSIRTHSFQEYWTHYKNNWNTIQFKEDTAPLLIFTGLRNQNDEQEYVEIYDLTKKQDYRLLFSEVGKMLAYKKHPFTKELILFVHEYPCCKSASHNIHTIRQLNGTIYATDRFFVGRDIGDMVGPFFPDQVFFDDQIHTLKQRTELRWSPEVVEKDAFEGWSDSNLIIHYKEGAHYRILYDSGEWWFVLFLNGIEKEQSRMLNYLNFVNKGVYGWIKKQ